MKYNKMKTCRNCKKEKELDLFPKDNRSKDGRASSCKECTNKKAKERRDKKLRINPKPIPKDGFNFCTRCGEEKE